MSKRNVNSEKAPAAIGPYSQAIEVEGTIYVSGQLPIDAATGNLHQIKSKDRQSSLWKILQQSSKKQDAQWRMS